jgi:hypothetical protein
VLNNQIQQVTLEVRALVPTVATDVLSFGDDVIAKTEGMISGVCILGFPGFHNVSLQLDWRQR